MKHILMLYLEPTQYILDLISELEKNSSYKITVLFVSQNVSQNWNLVLKKNKMLIQQGVLKTAFTHFIKNKYDVIFLAGWSHYMMLSFLLLAKIFRIPVAIDSDTCFLDVTPTWKRAIKKLLYPILFYFPNHFLPGGTRQAEYLRHYCVPERKITLEKMTVDVSHIQSTISTYPNNAKKMFREKWNLSNNDLVFLFVGRLIERKGIIELLTAFSQTNHPNVKCMIAGDGPLHHVVENTLKNIIYAGRLNASELIELYFLSDVFILPAHWEPWGLVINEAMAAGKPVITTNKVGCVDDLVIHNKTGLVIKEQCVTSIKNAIQFFIDNPRNVESMSQEALPLISNWTIADSAKQIVSAFEAIALPNSG